MTIHGNYISFASGGGTAGPIWLQAMQAIERFLPNMDFVTPDPQIMKGQTVPDSVAVRLQPVERGLDCCRSSASGRRSPSASSSHAPVGTVAYTSPTGQGVTGQTMLIYLSKGYIPPPPPPTSRLPVGGGGVMATVAAANGNGGGGNGGRNGGGGGGNGEWWRRQRERWRRSRQRRWPSRPTHSAATGT